MPDEDPPLTANGINRQLAKLTRQHDELLSEVDEIEKTAVHAREELTRCYAKAFLQATGAMDVRKQEALLETSDQRVAAELAEQQVKGLKRRIESVKLRVDVGRSLGASLRAEVGIAGSGGAL